MWLEQESEHYVFHYLKNSFAAQDIAEIIKTQERCFDYICRVLSVSLDDKIHYYFYDSPDAVGVEYGDNEPCNGFTRMPNKIFAVYNERVKCVGFHEDAHIISYRTLCRPIKAFLREGLAMYFDKTWWGIPNTAWTKYFIDKGNNLHISQFAENNEFYKYSDRRTYPLVGAFTEYLITVFGLRKYVAFYSSGDEDLKSAFHQSFGIDLEVAEQGFINYISSLHYSPAIFKAIEEELETRGER